MQDLLLIAAVAAAFLFGWYLMQRVGVFLENSRQAEGSSLSSEEDRLRIGVSDPLVADSLSDVLARYSQIQPDVSAGFFSGTEEELLRELSAQKLDVIFLTEPVENPSKARYDSRQILLNRTPVLLKDGGTPIEPVMEGAVLQNVLCVKTPHVQRFLACLQGA